MANNRSRFVKRSRYRAFTRLAVLVAAVQVVLLLLFHSNAQKDFVTNNDHITRHIWSRSISVSAAHIGAGINEEDEKDLSALTTTENVRIQPIPTKSPQQSLEKGKPGETSDKQNAQRSSSIALVRPFAPSEKDTLDSFVDEWNRFNPCRETSSHLKNDSHSEHYGKVHVDLILAYSRTLSPSEGDELQKRVESNNGVMAWRRCFRSVQVVSVGLSDEEDIYDVKAQGRRLDWVTGPNLVFQRLFRLMQVSYEAMLVMERDAHPRHGYWLDEILAESERKRPFSILGSTYRGDKWDAFRSELPSALINHLNGNAVYNLTSNYMNSIVTQLEAEVGTEAGATAYDYRIAQIDEQVSRSREAGSSTSAQSYELPQLLAHFKEHQALSLEPMKETLLIGNYAKTAMTDSMFPKQLAIEHGALTLSEYDSSKMGDITLVVSEWFLSVENVLSTVNNFASKFAEVILIVPFRPTEISIDSSIKANVRVVYRGIDGVTMDACSVDIRTPWFMHMNSQHRIYPNVPVMTTSDNQVVVFGTEGMPKECAEDPYCRTSETPWVYDSTSFLFHTELHKSYCVATRERNAQHTDEHIKPSATSFVAFIKSTTDSMDKTYLSLDYRLYGNGKTAKTEPGRLRRKKRAAENRRHTAVLPKYGKKSLGGSSSTSGGAAEETPDTIFVCPHADELLALFPYFEGGLVFFGSHETESSNLKVVQQRATKRSRLLLLHSKCINDAVTNFPGKVLAVGS